MLDHGGEGDGQDGDYGRQHEAPVRILKHCEGGVLHLERKAHPCGFLHGSPVHEAKACGHDVGTHDAKKDGDDLDHSLAEDVGDDDDDESEDGDPPVACAVLDGAAGQAEADSDDDGAHHYGREVTHHLLGSESGEETCQDEIHETGAEDADAGVRQGLREGEALVHAELGDGGVTSEESEGAAEESGHLELREEVEDKGAETSEEQCRGD